MSPVTVRVAHQDVFEAIEGLLTTARHEVSRRRGGREEADRQLIGSEVLLIATHREDGESREALVGFAALRRRGDSAFLQALYVDPPSREVGVGALLLDGAMRWAREAGCARIDATALPGDRATKNFFETHGLTARAIIVQREL